MADIHTQVEDWIRRKWLPKKFNQNFSKGKIHLNSGGEFNYDAVSEDKRIVVSISTSGFKTSGGRGGAGKLRKIGYDMFFMLLTPKSKKKLIVLTEKDMYDKCNRMKKTGRVPTEIKFMLAKIPSHLRTALNKSKK